MTNLLTTWITICTAGPTVDGRTIKEEWLTDAAETYNKEEYAAVVNCEHWYGNLGIVQELQTAKDDKGRTILQAKIKPNKYFLSQNSEGLRLFYSAEFIHNFAETGKTYLSGLATTDAPASLGTTETHFTRAVNAIKEFFTQNNNKEIEMTKEEFEKGMNPLKESFEAFSTKINDFVEKLSEKTDAPAEKEVPAEKENSENQNFAKELSALSSVVGDLAKKIDEALSTKEQKSDDNNDGDNAESQLI